MARSRRQRRRSDLGLVVLAGLAGLVLTGGGGQEPAPPLWAVGQRVVYRVSGTTEGTGTITKVYRAMSGTEWAYDLALDGGGTAIHITESRILRLANGGGFPPGAVAVSHTVHSGSFMTDFLVNDHPEYLHQGDVVAIISGNNRSEIDVGYLNREARKLRQSHGNDIQIYATTAGVFQGPPNRAPNFVRAAEGASNDFDGLSLVFEPGYWDFPTAAGDFPGSLSASAFHQLIARINSRCMDLCRPKGLKFLWRPTGLILDGNAQPRLGTSYGQHFAKPSDGCTVQTQRFCKGGQGDFERAVRVIVQQYRDAGVLNQRTLSTRITVGPRSQRNGVTAGAALNCAEFAWRTSGVTMPAIFPAESEMPEVRSFYSRRQALVRA